MTMSVHNLAVVGTGVMGRSHVERIHELKCCSLVALSDVHSCGEELASQHGAGWFQDTRAMLQETALDGVIICTPNESHAEVAIACLERGVPVLIEKPVAGSLEDAAAITTVASKTGVPVLVGHHRRHGAGMTRTRRLLEDDAIGRLVGVSMLWALEKPAEYFETEWRVRRPGGGPVMINLVHELDTLRYLCGEVVRVFAQSSSRTRGLDVEDTVSISLQTESGVLASILACDATPSPWSYEQTAHENPLYFESPENCYVFLGTTGGLAFPRMELWRNDDPLRRGWQYPLTREVVDVEETDPLRVQLEHFCDVIRGDAEPLVDAMDAERTLAVTHAVLKSCETGKPVDVSYRDHVAGHDEDGPDATD